MRCLGFCVSIDHARFMARHFTSHGIPSVAVWGDSPRDERHAALRDLAEGKVSAVFSVDLFNEGVDVPTVDRGRMLGTSKHHSPARVVLSTRLQSSTTRAGVLRRGLLPVASGLLASCSQG